MNTIIKHSVSPLIVAATLLGFVAVFTATAARAELSADSQQKVEHYKKKLMDWAKEPAIVALVREANASGGIPGMNNIKWDSLSESDSVVAAMLTNPVSKMLVAWDSDPGINKLYLRDAKGNVIAGSNKPLLYSIAKRPAMVVIETSKPWVQQEVKPDPTTQVKSVQLAVPVFDGGKPIGVLHTGVTID